MYAYSAELQDPRAEALRAKGYLVVVAVHRSDGKAMTENEVAELEAVFPPADEAAKKSA